MSEQEADRRVEPGSAARGSDHQRGAHPLGTDIDVTLDGCRDHRAVSTDGDRHRRAAGTLEHNGARPFGRVTYEMMEAAWRSSARTGARPADDPWTEPLARTIDAASTYVVSSTLDRVDGNAELVRGGLEQAVRRLEREPGRGLLARVSAPRYRLAPDAPPST